VTDRKLESRVEGALATHPKTRKSWIRRRSPTWVVVTLEGSTSVDPGGSGRRWRPLAFEKLRFAEERSRPYRPSWPNGHPILAEMIQPYGRGRPSPADQRLGCRARCGKAVEVRVQGRLSRRIRRCNPLLRLARRAHVALPHPPPPFSPPWGLSNTARA